MATFRRECRGLLRDVWQASGVPAGSSIRGEPPWDKAGCSGDSPVGVLAGLGTLSPCICRRFFCLSFWCPFLRLFTSVAILFFPAQVSFLLCV